MSESDEISDPPQSEDSTTVGDGAPSIRFCEVAYVLLLHCEDIVERVEPLLTEANTRGFLVETDPGQNRVHYWWWRYRWVIHNITGNFNIHGKEAICFLLLVNNKNGEYIISCTLVAATALFLWSGDQSFRVFIIDSIQQRWKSRHLMSAISRISRHSNYEILLSFVSLLMSNPFSFYGNWV